MVIGGPFAYRTTRFGGSGRRQRLGRHLRPSRYAGLGGIRRPLPPAGGALPGNGVQKDAGKILGKLVLYLRQELFRQGRLLLPDLNQSKAKIRRLAREAGLPVWDKPSYACLATRVPAGTPITAEALDRIARGEAALMALGFSDFRLRLRDGNALLQVREEQTALAERSEVSSEALPPSRTAGKPSWAAVFSRRVKRAFLQ